MDRIRSRTPDYGSNDNTTHSVLVSIRENRTYNIKCILFIYIICILCRGIGIIQANTKQVNTCVRNLQNQNNAPMDFNTKLVNLQTIMWNPTESVEEKIGTFLRMVHSWWNEPFNLVLLLNDALNADFMEGMFKLYIRF